MVSLSERFDALRQRLEQPTSPVLLTKNGPLSTVIQRSRSVKQRSLRAHLKFESRPRLFQPQNHQSFALPHKTLFALAILRETSEETSY